MKATPPARDGNNLVTFAVSQVFDATNTTMLRRRLIFDKVVLEMDYKLFYVESICDDPSIIEANIRVRYFTDQFLKQ